MLKILRNKVSLLGLALMMTMLLAFTQTAYAVDINGSMNVSRMVKRGAAECYRNLAPINAGDGIKALGRNSSGTWVFIWADVGDGWVPTSSVTLQGNVMSLSVWADAFQGEQCTQQPTFDSRICGRDGNTTTATTTRWTDIFATADPDTETGRAYPPNTTVSINGRDFWGCWVQVDGAGDSGWIPVNALNQNGVMGLPVLVDNSMGCTINGGTVTCPNN